VQTPEFWDPATTPRWLTLFDGDEEAPSLLAYCEPRMSDGFYVPKLSLPTLAFYWGQCQAHDRNGEWYRTVPRWRGDGLELEMAIPWPDGIGETTYAPLNPNPLYSQAANAAVFAVDGLPWQDGKPVVGKSYLHPLTQPIGGQ
jgi:hypothetical protein